MLSLSLLETSQLLQSCSVSPSALCNLAVGRLQLLQHLNAFITATPDIAALQADQADQRQKEKRRLGPLDGITLAFKDNFATRGVKTSCGSRILDPLVAPYTATVVGRSLQAGGVMLGKTNMDEFGMGSGTLDSYRGPTRSVWRSGVRYRLATRSGRPVEADTGPLDNEDWVVAGGSSGGSAVAVIGGVTCAALGSDTGGSVRVPAAWAGLPSFKPSYGLVSRHGLVPLVNSLDVPGLMARRVEDLAAYLNCLAGHDPLDSTTLPGRPAVELTDKFSPRGLRVGLPREYLCPGMSGEAVEAWDTAARLLESGGAEVVPVSLPHTDLAIPCYSVLNPAEVASNMARYDGLNFGLRGDSESSTEALFASTRSAGFNEVVRGRILAGNYFLLKRHYDEYFLKALKVRRMVRDDFTAAWRAGVDLLLTPVTLTDAPSYSEFSRVDNRTQTATQDYCTQPVNLAGLPAATVPVSLSARSLPLSVQLVGQFRDDRRLLDTARWLQDQLDFPSLVVEDDE